MRGEGDLLAPGEDAKILKPERLKRGDPEGELMGDARLAIAMWILSRPGGGEGVGEGMSSPRPSGPEYIGDGSVEPWPRNCPYRYGRCGGVMTLF